AQGLAAGSGRRLDDARPWVDARLADGSRLHAVLAPIAPAGTCLSLRVPRRRVFTLAELVAARTVPPDGADLLGRLVSARIAFLVTGGTATGKTTLLSALLSLAGDERLLLVEDASELRPAAEHIVRLEARPPNVAGAGEGTLGVVVHLKRSSGVRRVAEVCMLARGADGLVAATPAWTWDGQADVAAAGPAADRLAALLS